MTSTTTGISEAYKQELIAKCNDPVPVQVDICDCIYCWKHIAGQRMYFFTVEM